MVGKGCTESVNVTRWCRGMVSNSVSGAGLWWGHVSRGGNSG